MIVEQIGKSLAGQREDTQHDREICDDSISQNEGDGEKIETVEAGTAKRKINELTTDPEAEEAEDHSREQQRWNPFIPEEDGDNNRKCLWCNEAVCCFFGIESEIYLFGESLTPDDSASFRASCRKKAYRYATGLLYGPLGKNKRVKLPKCVEDGVRSYFPDPKGSYMGFRES